VSKIALNVMGGDFAPREMITGAKFAADRGHEVILIGDQSALELGMGEFETVVTTDNIAFDVSDPANAYRRSKDNPVRRAAELVKSGVADGFVDCGNTAVTLTGATLTLGRIRGVSRPAIPVLLPRVGIIDGQPSVERTLLLDAGANKESDARMLAQFGVMGSLYMSLVENIDSPRVGILSNGAEEEKGTALVKEAHQSLANLGRLGIINFIGNIEGSDLYDGGTDVAVTDGFSGNLILKSNEGIANMMSDYLVRAFGATNETRAAQRIMMTRLAVLRNALDPSMVGGALLLGVKGVAVIGHGSSTAEAVSRAIDQAAHAHQRDIVDRFSEMIVRAKDL